MKNKLWLLQIPFIVVCTFAFYVYQIGIDGRIENRFLRESLFPKLRNVSTAFSDMKFQLRGPRPPKNKIVIVEIDSPSIDRLGRWPWSRDVMGFLVDQVFALGAKTVGLDIVFSEPDRRLPEALSQKMTPQQFAALQTEFETDPVLGTIIAKHSDRLVLGWTPDANCQPLYKGSCPTPVNDPEVLELIPPGFDKFAYSIQSPTTFDMLRTPVPSVLTLLANLPEYNAVAQHSGYFFAFPDPDGVVRRTNLLFLANGKAYPSLPLEMARVGLNERLEAKFDPLNRVQSVSFSKSGRAIPVTPVGAVEMNFRGPGRTFTYVSAVEVLQEGEKLEEDGGRKLASLSKRDIFKDAYVLIGVSALGVFDMRAFPFDSNVPGVEGHATILDNLLSNDFLTDGSGWADPRWIYVLMIVGGVLFAYLAQRLEAIPALLLTVTVFGGMGAFDMKVLFENNINWNLSFLFIELSAIFLFTVAAKYVIEERNKKFVRGAFAKYVAPAVVDSILKDPTKLTVGGEKRDLTILFSDIRGFTTFSEKMDAKALAAFLNDYLSIQTKIVFDNEGTLDKYIGDAIMAFWGAPLDQPKHAANACKAAVQMMQALARNRRRFKEQYGVEVDIGIGLNSGVVSVGNMGSNENFAYTVIGDHVNLASRLEGLTKYYGASIVTSRFTFDTFQGAGEAVPAHRVLDFVKVKGKKNAVELIQVLDRDYPEAGLRLFEEARGLYIRQRWDEAITKFLEANAVIMKAFGESEKMDGPCEMYLERCEELKKSPPAPDWDGTWEMTSK